MPFIGRDFYFDDKVKTLSFCEEAIYVRLLWHQWEHNALPGAEQCANWPEFRAEQAIRESVVKVHGLFFIPVSGNNGIFHNPKLAKEKLRADKYRTQKQVAGHIGGVNKWRNYNSAISDATGESLAPLSTRHKRKHTTPTPTPTPTPTLTSTSTDTSTKEKKELTTGKPVAAQNTDLTLLGEKPEVPTAAIWDAYAQEYEKRYRVKPVRNAKVNAMVKHLLQRLGAEEAPHVARWYVQHNLPLYVRSRHDVALLLRDCEGLRTQWATGVVATTLESRQLEKGDEAVEQIKRVEARMKARDEEAKNHDVV